MPAVFVGHGSPMNVLEDNRYTQAWRELGATLPRPKAVLAISAHWYTRGTAVTVAERPRTIHDFGGFPQALYREQYPAPGDPQLARRVTQLLQPIGVAQDHGWGLDHGTWSVLAHMYPQADVPVIQLSIDGTQPVQFHYDLGRRLAPLRDEGVLIVGSGNVVHNLRTANWNAGAAAYPWAMSFDAHIRDAISRGDGDSIVHYERCGEAAALSVPTPDHYLPLLYVLGTRQPDEPVSFPVDGIELGSISMLTVALGR